MIDGFQTGVGTSARDVGTLAEAGYRNGRGSAMRYGSRIGRDTGRVQSHILWVLVGCRG